MVQGQSPVSLICTVLVLAALAVPRTASAQRTDLYWCLVEARTPPPCFDVGGSVTFSDSDCPRQFDNFLGRVGFYPLQYVGPIEVEIETIAAPRDRFPLYVEIVPLIGREAREACENAPGFLLMTLFPNRSRRDPCDYWERSGVVDLSAILPLGSPYTLRLYFFHHPSGNSPAADCVRVTPHPELLTVTPLSWGKVKWLYH